MMQVKQISDNELQVYLFIKYIKSVLWRVAKRLSYTQDARCLKVKVVCWTAHFHLLMTQENITGFIRIKIEN